MGQQQTGTGRAGPNSSRGRDAIARSERMRLHMERDGKGEMNCWAALGMDAAAGEAAYADAQKSSDKQEQDTEAWEKRSR